MKTIVKAQEDIERVKNSTPTHEDWKAYKKERGLKNSDIAKIIDSTVNSVKSMTQPNKPLPKWVITMLYEWKSK